MTDSASLPQRPQLYTAKLADKVTLNDKFRQYYFELMQPDILHFQAGQYVSISLPDSQERRSYSICSSPEKDHGFELLIDLTPNGKGVQYLESLKFGDQITFLAPLGQLIIPSEMSTLPNQQLMFVATGSGIAPFRSLVLDQLQQKHNLNPITLFWGMRHEAELFWLDEFEDLMTSYPQFHFHPVISQALPEWPLCRGHVTDCLTAHERLEFADYFLCGSTGMITDVEATLAKLNVPKEKVHREKFY